MFLKNMPIRRKLMVIILLTTVAALLLMRSVSLAYEFLTFRQALIEHLSTVGEVIATNSTAALAFDNKDDAEENLAALKAEKNVIAAALYDESGKLFATYPLDMPATSLPTGPDKTGYRYQGLSLSGFQPVVQSDKKLGTLYLRLDTEVILRQWFRNSLGIAIAVIGIAFVAAYLLSKTLQKQISQPILALAETATAISNRQDYSVRATRLGNDELGRLTDAFNHMLAQIQELKQDLEERVTNRTAELVAANKELESFSYSVSHDLRAPLRHVQGYVEMLREAVDGQLPAKALRYLKTITEASVEMGQLIDDLLAFSHTGKAEMNETSVELDALVEDTIRSLEMATLGRNIVWKIAHLPEVTADPSTLKQVFANLIGNAIKYSRQRDPAEIEVGYGGEEEGRTIFFVRDNGAGFDMRYAHKLFGVFQRLHRADEFEGTGIGLATVRRIITRHNGRTWAEGKVDEGATFYFTLKTTRKLLNQPSEKQIHEFA